MFEVMIAYIMIIISLIIITCSWRIRLETIDACTAACLQWNKLLKYVCSDINVKLVQVFSLIINQSMLAYNYIIYYPEYMYILLTV